MQNVQRMLLVCRRLFSTSISSSSKSRRGTPDPQPTTSAFASRFGSPTHANSTQAPFPAWPGAQPTQPSSHVNPLTFRPPPSGLVDTSETKTNTESLQANTARKRPVKSGRWKEKKKELFSDCIGNASAFTNTSSFEAKLAIEPAVGTYKRWMLAAKNNIERFRSLPDQVEHKPEESDSVTEREEDRFASDDNSKTKPSDSTSESSPKTPLRTLRSPIVTPSGRRMLSTITTDPALYLPQAGCLAETTPKSAPHPAPNKSLWKECVRWMLASTPDIRPYSQPPMSGFMRRLCASWNRSRQPLSFFQPAYHPSLPMFARGYATRRRPKHFPYILIPAPTTPTELCNALRQLFQSTKPPAPIPRLIATHAQYPTLQTHESFNALLEYAVRISPVPYVAQIVAQMRTRGISWNQRTERLVVRAHIKSGRWLEAIQLAEKLWLDGNMSRTPLDIFAELLHFALTKKASVEDVAAMANRCWKLYPSGAGIDAVHKSPRLAFNVIRLLVNTGKHDRAIQIAKKLLESLDSPTPPNIRYCREILRYIIRPPRDASHPPLFQQQRELLESLLAHNPSLGLIPDARLTTALLENLFRSRKRGPRALHALLELKSKYGPEVEDGAVRRLIARYALDEGRIDLAREMFERERLARLEAATTESQPSSKQVPWAREEPIPAQSHLEYLRHAGTENSKWVVVAKRLRREEVKAGLGEPPNPAELTHPKSLLAAEKRALGLKRLSPGRIQRKIARRTVRLHLRRGNTIKD